MFEKWIPIKNFESLYEISNTRKIRALERISKNNKLLHQKELKFSKNGKYDVVQLIDKNKNKKIYYVDRLMYEHFNKKYE